MADKDTRKEPPPPKPSLEDEAQQVVRQHIDDQKALIKKLRKEQ